MKKHRFLLYPAGAPGTGLLILRGSVVVFLLSYPTGRFAMDSPPALALDMLALLIGLGLCMRTIACAAAAVAGAVFLTEQGPLSTSVLAHVLDAAVLAICGPGAFSLDARLFGRATVHLAS